MVTDQTLRLLRGITVAIAAVALPVAGHGMAGGPVTVTAPTVLVFLFVAALTTSISSREWTLPRIVAVLLPVQVLVHVALTAGGGAHAAHLTTAAPVQQASPSAGMLVAHGLALVVVILWLRLAERSLVRFVALAERLFCRAAITAAPITVAVPTEAPTRQLIPLRRTRIVRPRAPPALSFV